MDDIEAAQRLLWKIGENSGHYISRELLSLKNTADTISYVIRLELKERDARMVDQACALKEPA